MIDISTLDEHGLEDILSEPTEATKKVLWHGLPAHEISARMAEPLDGDIVVLGAGGKMGPTLAMMLKKACPTDNLLGRRASSEKNIYAVSRFTDKAVKNRIEQAAVKTIEIDLMDESAYQQLPNVENVFYLVGMKFGVTDNQPLTWALNSFLPGLAARHYKDSRIVVFSTGNVYPLVDIESGGATEQTPCEPIGEYAQSCLGRERIFQYFSQLNHTPMTIARLNYANEPRYGIIVDITLKILNNEPVDLTMPAVNLIWQTDAIDYIIRSLTLAQSPPAILNVTGPDKILIHQLAEQIGGELNIEPRFASGEAQTALLSNASYCCNKFGYPQMPLDEMVSLIVKWVAAGKKILNKPTKYDIRDGKF